MCVESGLGKAEDRVERAAEQCVADILGAYRIIEVGITHDFCGIGTEDSDVVVFVEKVIADGVRRFLASGACQYQSANHQHQKFWGD